jgi:signal transduction histidine kinase
MTRRIATAILLTVWAILVAGGCAAYWVTRSVLLTDLDNSLVANVRALPQVGGGRAGTLPPTAQPEDRYLIKNAIGQTVGTPADLAKRAADDPLPPHTAAFMTLPGGKRFRKVSVRLPAVGNADGTAGAPAGGSPDGSREGSAGARAQAGGLVTVVYSRPTDQLDRVLNRLAVALAVFGLAAGAGAAAVAVGVARAALRPLQATADVVGVIDEKNLDRRIDEHSLPAELRPVASRLNAMLERLDHAFAQRKQFLADASHELRTPVAALVTTLEVALRRKRDAAELTRTLENCLSDARYLRRLVTTLLELARGESAGEPAAEAFDAAAVLDQCVAVAEALAASREVRVVRSYAGPLSLVSDPDLLRGIVTNLLANAVEHNRAGGVVELCAGVAGGVLRFSVRDTGPGISPEHLPNVFQPFYRAEASRRRGSEPHLGLGLFIVESHLKAVGGTCRVESKEGVGTVIHVEVPGRAIPASFDALRAGVNISPRAALLEGEGSRK